MTRPRYSSRPRASRPAGGGGGRPGACAVLPNNAVPTHEYAEAFCSARLPTGTRKGPVALRRDDAPPRRGAGLESGGQNSAVPPDQPKIRSPSAVSLGDRLRGRPPGPVTGSIPAPAAALGGGGVRRGGGASWNRQARPLLTRSGAPPIHDMGIAASRSARGMRTLRRHHRPPWRTIGSSAVVHGDSHGDVRVNGELFRLGPHRSLAEAAS